jgi:hypothetical protein
VALKTDTGFWLSAPSTITEWSSTMAPTISSIMFCLKDLDQLQNHKLKDPQLPRLDDTESITFKG